MPGISPIKGLYLAKSIAELQKQGSVPSQKPDLLVKVSQKLLTNAKECEINGDQEKAYVLFFKYCELAKTIRKTLEYKKDKLYYDSMVSPKSVKDALDHLDSLTMLLNERYEEKEKKEALKTLKNNLKAKSPSPMHFLNNGNVINGDEPNEDKSQYIIDPMRLYSIFTEKATTFLLLDARPSADYKASHIKHPSSINVPGEALNKGITVKSIERQLHIEYRGQWGRRTGSDMLILFDWSSDEFVPNTPLTALKDALFHWDAAASGTSYKSKQAYILKGGFDNFALSYPTYVTNPQKSRPPTTKSSAKNSAIDIDNVEYPDLDAAFIITPTSSHESSPSPALASGAITVSDPLMEAVNSPSRPKIPDRKTKPTASLDLPSVPSVDRSSIASDMNSTEYRNSRASVGSEFNKAMVSIDDSSSASDDSSYYATSVKNIIQPSRPIIDRSLKAKALMKSVRNPSQNEVLEAERDIVEDSLRLENEELKMEEEWEKLRLRKENALSEEMRSQVIQREDELIKQLAQLSLDKEAKDRENKDLMKQLEAMKARLEAKEDDKYVQDEIERKLREKEERRRNVEKLRKERLKKQKEDEEMKIQKLNEGKRQAELAKRKREETERAIHENISKQALKKHDGGSGSGGGGLNRSYSSPNIKKMLDDEDQGFGEAKVPIPNFDRGSKPAISDKSRNFAAVWGTSKKGLTGLRNLGNTCYMNSLLQCLSNFTLPSQYFMGDSFKKDLNQRSETRGEIAIEFAEVIRMLWSDQYKSIAPYDFKRVIGKHSDMFRGSDQQDAHELLLILMEFLHQDVNSVREKVRIPEQNNDRIPELEAAQSAWKMERQADRSFIRETFYGQQRSTLTCPHCNWVSVTYESFFELPLKLPAGNKRCSLKQLIETYLSKDQVPYKCPTCKKERQCVKQFEIVKLPLILTVSLGRFYNDGISRKKQNMVDFELTGVNFGQYATACNGQLNRYRDYTLYGVCNHYSHSGSLESGHYTASCYSQVYRKWYKYDDTEVYEMDNPNDVKKPAAYILFYSAKN